MLLLPLLFYNFTAADFAVVTAVVVARVFAPTLNAAAVVLAIVVVVVAAFHYLSLEYLSDVCDAKNENEKGCHSIQ